MDVATGYTQKEYATKKQKKKSRKTVIPLTLNVLTTLCPRKNCTPRQCTVELSSPNAS